MGKPEQIDPQIDTTGRSSDHLSHDLFWTQLKRFVVERFSPKASPDEGLRYWQEWILQTILGVSISFGLFGLIPALIITLFKSSWHLIILNIGILVFCLFLTNTRKLTYTKRVIGVLVICYTIGLGQILVLGFSSGGPYWLFAFAIIAALLLDVEAAMVTLVLNAATLILAIWLPQKASISPKITIDYAPTQLAITWLNFLWLNAITALSVSLLVRNLDSVFFVERNAKIALDIKQQKLISTQKTLRKEVKSCKEREVALRKRENQHRILTENVVDHIWILDLEAFLFIYTSPSITSILGYSPSEIIGTSLWDYIHPESIELVKKKLFEELRKKKEDGDSTKGMGAIEFMERRKDGKMVWVETQISFIRDKDGDPVSILGVSRDISRRKAAETKLVESYAALDQRVWERIEDISVKNKQLEQEIEKRKRAQEISDRANRAKSDFLANMSHELRTPLNHIIGFTELVIDRHFGQINSVQEEYLNDVLGSSRHLLSLINDILDLSKIEAGKMVFNPAEVRINSVLATSFNMIREKTIKHKIQLTSEIGPMPKKIKADERKLKQIMYNLLSNAAKFTPDSGQIHVTAQCISAHKGELCLKNGKKIPLPLDESESDDTPRKYIEIMVSDTGIGLVADDMTSIFKPFEQVESDSNRRYEGTGLGLPLSRRLVKLHGGWMWVESDGLNKGCRFFVVIPVDGPS
jgi:PAS domain S-box-containing protein